jgi:hypothetical protein
VLVAKRWSRAFTNAKALFNKSRCCGMMAVDGLTCPACDERAGKGGGPIMVRCPDVPCMDAHLQGSPAQQNAGIDSNDIDPPRSFVEGG